MYNAAEPLVFVSLVIIVTAALAGWVWGMVHCLGNHHLMSGDKAFFILLMFALGPIGTIIYFASLSGPAIPRQSHTYHRLHPHHHDHWHQPLA